VAVAPELGLELALGLVACDVVGLAAGELEATLVVEDVHAATRINATAATRTRLRVYPQGLS
jgi:hypothetical protein